MSLKFAPRLKELRFHLCQKSSTSGGLRDFINDYYVEIKKQNKIPILIRECSGVQPRMWARFEKGVEQSYALTNLKSSDIFDRLKSVTQ